jgi:AhpD family alkylhydroperoxidase
MNNAKLRHFHNVKDFFTALSRMVQGTKFLKQAADGKRIAPALAEKIMLAVTSVNECAYCSYLHTQTALAAGVEEKRIREILSGAFDNGNPQETIALLYAQHWAESRGATAEQARTRLAEYYGPDLASQIEGYLRIIYMGNMCSNTTVFFEDKSVPKTGKAGLLPVYLLCKPIASSIRRRGIRLAGKRPECSDS